MVPVQGWECHIGGMSTGAGGLRTPTVLTLLPPMRRLLLRLLPPDKYTYIHRLHFCSIYATHVSQLDVSKSLK